jgi:hypothetical protein
MFYENSMNYGIIPSQKLEKSLSINEISMRMIILEDEKNI